MKTYFYKRANGVLIRIECEKAELREQEILNITQRKVAQGVSADEQYAALNAARDKRKRRRERNIKILFSGGCKQVPILNP